MTIEAQWSADDDERRWEFEAQGASDAQTLEIGYEAALPGLQAFQPHARASAGATGAGRAPGGVSA